MSYYTPSGGLPDQTELLTDRAIVKEAYTVIPRGVLRDIVTSNLPGFTNTRSWILARPICRVRHDLLAAHRPDQPRWWSGEARAGGRGRRRRVRDQR